MTNQNAWQLGSPLYSRLPGVNQGFNRDLTDPDYDPMNPPDVTYFVTKYFDDFLIETRDNINNVYADFFNPDTARDENLDWLAQLAGFTGGYWDSSYPPAIKRELIKNAFTFVWENKGTQQLLEYLFDLFNLEAYLYLPGELLLGVTPLPGILGGDPFYYLILVDFYTAGYLRNSKEFRQLEKLNQLYGAVWCESRVAYSDFIVGFSFLGDPVFEEGYTV